ncbi:MAG: phosphodiester glycosidase family protein [Bacteroidetes bacterium]|nr:phosphodiester glycosidase family protein [Bacteroidota bacterium]
MTLLRSFHTSASHLIKRLFIIPFLLVIIGATSSWVDIEKIVLFHIVDLTKQELSFYWKDDNNKVYKDFKKLKTSLEMKGKKLRFAMNGGMYKKDFSPQGLYIENGKQLSPLDTTVGGHGNFYLKPNGVFYITDDNKAVVRETGKLDELTNIHFATQSGPMLLIDGQIHTVFTKGSKNLNIRNGVGILPNGTILFAMSVEMVNFFDFATYFKKKGCTNALYLDGFVSKTYLPEKGFNRLNGNFGVIIAETN